MADGQTTGGSPALGMIISGIIASALFRSARNTGPGGQYELIQNPGPVLRFGTCALVALNLLLAFGAGGPLPARRLGALAAQAVFLIVPVVVFSLAERFRIPRVRMQVLFWTAITMLIIPISRFRQ